MEIWLATTNKGKLTEFRGLINKPDVKISSIADLPSYTPPPETGKTFEENARIKAKSLKAVKSNCWVLGEDSGLEVDGLNKMPGIHSARYAGPKASDRENIAKLLKMMSIRSATHRKARFVCSLIAYSPEGKEYLFEGHLEGEISRTPTGNEGFGYDCVFIPEGQTKTLGELGLIYKNKVSHRAHAIRKMAEIL